MTWCLRLSKLCFQNECSVNIFGRINLLLSSEWSRLIICLQASAAEENNNKCLTVLVFFFISLRFTVLYNKYTQSPPRLIVDFSHMSRVFSYKSLNPGHQDRQSRLNHSSLLSPVIVFLPDLPWLFLFGCAPVTDRWFLWHYEWCPNNSWFLFRFILGFMLFFGLLMTVACPPIYVQDQLLGLHVQCHPHHLLWFPSEWSNLCVWQVMFW